MDRWSELCAAVEPHRQRVIDHEVYKRLDNIGALRIFTEHHVWAVWDFMSLLTELQTGRDVHDGAVGAVERRRGRDAVRQ